ncbi:helix-turn-helix domain-containing protein [Brachybacterium subflavum]|uniref:helix-turn-helix domain-containing protein n=1 Tax=Brachybacterium subflavum TaxID=2585206 RepID=UPI00187A063B|nr:helix-turn-helix domain-containing protein [Brachybacterium subflavum]
MPTKLAVTIDEAADLVPFSADYLRKAIRRTDGNPLPARLAGRKYVIRVADLEEWLTHEGVAA